MPEGNAGTGGKVSVRLVRVEDGQEVSPQPPAPEEPQSPDIPEEPQPKEEDANS